MVKGQYLTKNKFNNLLIWAYFIIAFIEIIAEFFKDNQFIWLTKPLIIPLLALFYWRTSKHPNTIFLIALLFNWIANMFFITQDYHHTVIGAYLFLVYRVAIIYLVLKMVKFPGIMPIFIGSLPFLLAYLYFINLTYESLGDGIYIFVIQGILIVFLAAFALGNYIFKPNSASILLLISTVFFTVTQFILVLKYCYISLNIFQTLAMFLFVLGQYVLVKFLLLLEKRPVKYGIINNVKSKEP